MQSLSFFLCISHILRKLNARARAEEIMLVTVGFLGVLVSLVAYVFPVIRNAEEILPDFENEKVA